MKTTLFNRITILLSLLFLITPLVQGQEVDKSFNKTPQEMHDMFMQKHKTKSSVFYKKKRCSSSYRLQCIFE